jgi:predicted glycosyltransferase
LYGEDESNPRFLGYTEKTVITYLVSALNEISRDCKKDITLIIRIHPRETPDEFNKIRSDDIRILVSATGDPRDIVMASDLVIGMNTELLVEACYLGCIVVSLQPGLRFGDVLLTNSEGFSVPVYSKEKISETVRKMLMDPDIRSEMKNKLEHFKHDGHATDRVVSTIHQMITAGK